MKFWGDSVSQCPEWVELLVIAWRSGTLLDEDPGRLLERLEATAAGSAEVPDLPSEEPGVREIAAERLRELRESADARARYGALLRDFWGALEPFWRSTGRRVAGEMAAELRRKLRECDDLRAVLPSSSFVRKERYAPLIAASMERGQLVLVPLAMALEGKLMYALPDLVVIGHGPEADRTLSREREQAAAAAARLKVLADPTRNAILGRILHHPTSITDLASMLDLSQPTVSVHVKMLREAGLVKAEKSGASTLYSAERATIERFVTSALSGLTGLS